MINKKCMKQPGSQYFYMSNYHLSAVLIQLRRCDMYISSKKVTKFPVCWLHMRLCWHQRLHGGQLSPGELSTVSVFDCCTASRRNVQLLSHFITLDSIHSLQSCLLLNNSSMLRQRGLTSHHHTPSLRSATSSTLRNNWESRKWV